MDLFGKFKDGNPTIEEIRDLNKFSMIIQFTKVTSLSNDSIKNAIADLIVKRLVQQLQSASLFGFSSISVSTEDGIKISYTDDIYHFGIWMTEEKFAFIRSSSTIEDFMNTCEIFIPFFISLYKDVVTYIQGAVQNIIFVPHFCGYRFEFKIEDFRPSVKTAKAVIPNYELMERLVPSIEKAESPVSKVGFAQRARTDLNMSGTLQLDDINWLGWIGIEAPGNQNYSTMDLTFELQSLALEDTLSKNFKREPFNPQSINSWETPFLGFLKEKIFCGFLQDWLGDVKVKSVR